MAAGIRRKQWWLQIARQHGGDAYEVAKGNILLGGKTKKGRSWRLEVNMPTKWNIPTELILYFIDDNDPTGKVRGSEIRRQVPHTEDMVEDPNLAKKLVNQMFASLLKYEDKDALGELLGELRESTGLGVEDAGLVKSLEESFADQVARSMARSMEGPKPVKITDNEVKALRFLIFVSGWTPYGIKGTSFKVAMARKLEKKGLVSMGRNMADETTVSISPSGVLSVAPYMQGNEALERAKRGVGLR